MYYDFFWFVIDMDVVITMQAYASEISNQKYQALGISMVRCSLQFCKHIFNSLLQLYFVCLMQAQLCELRNITMDVWGYCG